MALIGISLAVTSILIGTKWLLDERAIMSTQGKMRQLAEMISKTNFTPAPIALRHYEQDVGALPSALPDLVTKPVAVPTCSISIINGQLQGWCGPYWNDTYSGENTFGDGFGRAIIYDKAGRQLRSMGVNGVDDKGAVDDIVQAF